VETIISTTHPITDYTTLQQILCSSAFLFLYSGSLVGRLLVGNIDNLPTLNFPTLECGTKIEPHLKRVLEGHR